jgi:hypothetical protein
LANSVNIGFVTTPQWDNIYRRRAPEVPAEEFFAQLAADKFPPGRLGRVRRSRVCWGVPGWRPGQPHDRRVH